VVNVPWTDAAGFDAKLTAERIAAIYVCPGLNDQVAAVAAVSRRKSILTVTGTEEYVQGDGLSVALMPKSSRSMVLVNLRAAKAEGADLDSGLLAIAEVMR
jgi:hypothetical protein